jgi:hypothetical protein
MSLAPGERRGLATIEGSLRSTDHKLATCNVLASHGRTPWWKWPSPWRLRLRRIMLMMVGRRPGPPQSSL